MKVTTDVIKVNKPKINVKLGQIYKGPCGYYMVTKATNGSDSIKFNLTNLNDGGRWTDELTLSDLSVKIEYDGFKYVDAVELVIKVEE